MSALSNEEFAKKVMETADSQAVGRPVSYYDRDGDCIEFLAEPKNFYAERVDDLVTVYYDEDTDEIIGSLLKGVSQFLKKHPNLGIIIDSGGRVKLAHLFLAGILSKRSDVDKITILTYRKLIQCAEETQAEAQMCIN